MSWIVSNWYLIVIFLVVIAGAVAAIMWFMRQPSAIQKENVKEWLKYAVTEAETALGSGTGQLKLRMVYSMAVERFPWISACISFNTFSTWVDFALEWMNQQLSSNHAIQEYVNP